MRWTTGGEPAVPSQGRTRTEARQREAFALHHAGGDLGDADRLVPELEAQGVEIDQLTEEQAKEHLWMHFTRMGEFGADDVPIIVRGDGCHLEDSN